VRPVRPDARGFYHELVDEERDQGTAREEGRELLERVWRHADLDEEKARRLAVEAQHEARRSERLRRFLEEEVWPGVTNDVAARPLSKEERERILGYGPDGV
jgi:hypothetical protein